LHFHFVTMRFALWSQSHEVSLARGSATSKDIHTNSNSKLTSKRKSTESENKNERKTSDLPSPGERTKSRGRYDVPEGTKKSRKKADSRDDLDAYPIIDRIPTAIGYLSDGSDEEWFEEKSRVSRYDISDAPSDDDLDIEDDDNERNNAKEEMEEESNDKYSQKIVSKKKKQEHVVLSDTISRLWSESTDSEIDENERKTDQELAIDSKLDREEIASYSEEKGTDPIYEGSPKNREKSSKSGKERKSPNNVSDTSSNSDNLNKMLHYATTSDQVVREIEEKIKLLKAVAAEEYEFTRRQAKESKKEKRQQTKKGKRPPKKETLNAGTINQKSKRNSAIETKHTPENIKTVNGVSCDEIELTRSISRADSNQLKSPRLAALKSITQMFQKKKTTGNSFTDGISTCPSDETGSMKSGRPIAAMYTKSLISEDSENAPVEQSGISKSAQAEKLANKLNVSPSGEMITEAKVESRKHRIGSLLAYTRNLGFKSRSNLSNAKEGKSATGVFFWKKQENRRDREEMRLLEESCSNKEAKLSTGSTSPRSKQNEVKEMDEYSKSTKEMNPNEPDVVQCLRFFQCGSVANQVNTAIAVASCGGANNVHDDEENIDDNFDILESGHLALESSDPTVEVVLKDGLISSVETKINKETGLSCGNSLSCQNGTPDEDDFLTEAPGLPMSRVPSIVVDVSDMQLHLDGDSEADRMAHSVSIGGNRSRSDLSITSINVPILSSNSDNDDEQKSKTLKSNKATKAKLPRKGIKIRKIFSRFAKK
jgi:hypothetical protein